MVTSPERGLVLVGLGMGAVTVNDASAPDTKLASHRVDFASMQKGGYDPDVRVADMDLDGVDAEILYPTVCLLLYTAPDADYRRACVRVYNDWLAEFCSARPERLYGVALLDVEDPGWAVEEMRRAKEAGMVGCMVPGRPPDGDYHETRFDPLWEAASASQLPVSVHAFTDRTRKPSGPSMFMDPIHQIQRTLVLLAQSGVFTRHPRLRVVVSEFDAGWVPHFFERFDSIVERRGDDEAGRPSDVLRRHVHFGFQVDRVAVALREWIGTETLLWGSDYPHVSSFWPRSLEVLDELLAGVPDADRAAITGGNAVGLYGLTVANVAAAR